MLEIFQRPDASPTVQRGYLRFLLQMCELASEYLKSRKLQHFTDRQALWAQLENFTRLVHQRLDPRETAYTIANEGRRLIECDRVSVAIKQRPQVHDRGRQRPGHVRQTLEHRARCLTQLATAVVATGETVWYTGDTSMMAPQVEDAVQEYVDEVPLEGRGRRAAQGAARQDRSAWPIPRCSGADHRADRRQPPARRPAAAHRRGQRAQLDRAGQRARASRPVPDARVAGDRQIALGGRSPAVALDDLDHRGAGRAVLFMTFWPADFELTANGTLQPAVEREVFAPKAAT